jgi:hypothetical protein
MWTREGPVNLSGKLPDDDSNGMHRVAHALLTDPMPPRLAVIEYTVQYIKTNVGTGERAATLAILAIEPIVDRDESLRARALLNRERRRRHALEPMTGQLDLLDELDPDRHTPIDDDGEDDGERV